MEESMQWLHEVREVFPKLDKKIIFAAYRKMTNKKLGYTSVNKLVWKMKTKLSKQQTQEKIESFFKKLDFSPEEIKKIKRLAMKFNIKLKEQRKNFCKKCLNKLKGKIRVSKTHKTIECEKCRYRNKFRITK